MARSICFCEPPSALAGEEKTWKFIYQPAVTLPKGTNLKFDLMSKGRSIDWEVPSTNLKDACNTISMRIADGKPIPAEEVELPDRFTPQFEFILPQKVEAGKDIIITVGSNNGTPKTKNVRHGTTAQTYTQRRRPFMLYVDPSGKGHYQDPDVFSMDIRGNELKNIRVLAPSYVLKNRRFDVIVRFEDEFGNLTSNAPDNTLIELSYENIRENLNWKIFVPETGFITLPNLYFNELGVFTITLKNLANGETFRSSPIRCFQEQETSLFWGVLHGESERIDSTENIESCLRHFRDDRAINFFATSSFENAEETPNDVWKLIQENVAEFNEDDRFTALLGFQWAGDAGEEGVRQILYSKDSKPLLRKKDAKSSQLKKIYRSHAPKEIISIPSFTMAKGYHYDFENFTPEFERVVEIYNAWGSSECTAAQGNTLPISGRGAGAVAMTGEGSITAALIKGHRFGFVAGGLDDRGIYGDLFNIDQDQYPGGLTAIIAKEQSRDALFDALYRRSCYATTGERIALGFTIANVPMGGEVTTQAKPGLAVNRHIAGFAAGTAPLSAVEIIRNGTVIKSLTCDSYHLDFTFDDMQSIGDVALDRAEGCPFVFYYIRVVQTDGHIAWSSPIWIDHDSTSSLGSKTKKPEKAKK